MPISAGDVVLTFTADMTQLDAAFNQVANETAAKLQPAVTAMGGLGQAAQTTGKAATDAGSSLADAFNLIPPAVQKSDTALQNMAFALTTLPLADASEKVERFGRDSVHAMGLLSEASNNTLGVGIPRHIRSFLLELPGVAKAMEAAFSVVSVLFLIDIISKVIEKIIEFAHEAEEVKRMTEEWDKANEKVFRGLEDGLLKAQIRTAELTGNHFQALQLKLQQIDNATLGKLRAELEKLGADADKLFAKLDRSWFSQMLLGLEGSDAAQEKFKDLKKTVDDALSARGPEAAKAYADALKKLQQASDNDVTPALKRLNDQLKLHDEQAKSMQGVRGAHVMPAPDPNDIKAWQLEGDAITKWTADIKKAQEQAKEEKKDVGIEERKKSLEEEIVLFKHATDIKIANIELVKAEAQKAFQQGKISAKEAAEIEVKAAFDARKAQEQYLETVVALYKKAGDSQKAYAAQQDLDKVKISNLAKANTELAKAIEEASKEEKKFNDLSRQTVAEMEKIGQVEVTAPLSKIAKDALQLNADLKKLGIEGWIPLRQQLAAAADAEKKLNAAGIHDGKLWLEVQVKKQKALILEAQQQKKTTDEEIKQLHKLENELRAYDGVVKDSKSQVAAAWTGEALAAAFAADSVGAAAEAILNSVLKNLAGMAFAKGTEQLAEGLARLNPFYAATHGPPGPHFASAAEWFALGGVAGIAGAAIGGGGSGKSGSSSASSGPSVDSGSSANHPAQQPVSTVNIAHLASGGLVDTPQLAMIGHGREGVIPLDNPQVMDALREGLALGQGITVIVEGIPMHKLARKFSSDQKKGKYRVHSTSTARTIRQY